MLRLANANDLNLLYRARLSNQSRFFYGSDTMLHTDPNTAILGANEYFPIAPPHMKTTHKEIVDYWAAHESECGLSVDWSEAETRCWRCAEETALHRCHIVPDALQGDDHPSNLVLLCLQCHRDAPNVTDPSFMWHWLRTHAVPYYGEFWMNRAIQEFELLYGRKPFSTLDQSKIDPQSLANAIAEYMQCVTHHFGEGRLNSSTKAWLLRQLELEAQKQTDLASEQTESVQSDPSS